MFAVKLPLIVRSLAGMLKVPVLFHPLKVYPGAVAASATVKDAPYLYDIVAGKGVAPGGIVPVYV